MDRKRNWLELLNTRRRSFLKAVGAGTALATTSEIGRASCRERVS
jgi:anaerobic dimethyl sulfoxide reductase subunit A